MKLVLYIFYEFKFTPMALIELCHLRSNVNIIPFQEVDELIPSVEQMNLSDSLRLALSATGQVNMNLTVCNIIYHFYSR